MLVGLLFWIVFLGIGIGLTSLVVVVVCLFVVWFGFIRGLLGVC